MCGHNYRDLSTMKPTLHVYMIIYANLLHYDDNSTFHTARAGDASTSKSSGGTADSSHSNTGMLLEITELGSMTLSSIITVTVTVMSKM